MTLSPLASKPAPKEMLVDLGRLEQAYFTGQPDPADPAQRVSFGTSGHRGSSLRDSFTEAHILAITQAICDYRQAQGVTGPLFMGKDTHALSSPAQRTALEVLAANDVVTVIQRDDGFTPTPVISHAILTHNRGRSDRLADGIVITPSHNPPEDGGFKYNPTNGGPADTDVTQWVERRANELLHEGNAGVRRVAFAVAVAAETTTVDHDGAIRMDCSSPYAMARLIGLKDHYRVAFANDPDSDRHGVVTPSAGLMNPNHYLAVAIDYLLAHRPGWSAQAAIGKTVVSSSMIDRVVQKRGRRLSEVPVGFKWFAPGLFDGDYCFGGEESAGASFLRRDGSVWTTDKDGLIMNLLAAEITACTGRDLGELYKALTKEFGVAHYTRIDAPATPEQKARLARLSPEMVRTSHLGGEAIIQKLTRAPGNNAAIGGLKVVTANGWFAARPSGTEAVYKIYAESFRDEEHLETLVNEAQEIVRDV